MASRVNQNVCFIVGTDTGVGKTLITAGLYRAAIQGGYSAIAIKPVQTGANDHKSSDTSVYDSALNGIDSCKPFRSDILLCYKTPCSPHLAARVENQTIKTDELVERISELHSSYEMTFVEGAGGLLVPLNDTETTADLIEKLNASVLLVVDNKLGCINHALLTLAELKRRNITVHGVIINHTAPQIQDKTLSMILRDNPEAIFSHGNVPVLASVPYMESFHADHNGDNSMFYSLLAKHLAPVVEFIANNQTTKELCKLAETGKQLEYDREHLWHPYTSMVDPHPVVMVSETRGAEIVLDNNKKLVDGMSSWWCAIHGYNHPNLCDALKRQLETMPHIMFGGITHKPAIKLAESLLSMLPPELNRIFFCDSGSVSVEVAMKMAIQFHHASQNTEKTRFMTFRGGYHGDTLDAMSVCDPINGMHTLFSGIIPLQIFLPRPAVPFSEVNTALPEFEITQLESAFEQYASETAAFILEPIVQGAGGMWFYHPDYLRHISRLCKQYDVLLIADEIATGFGRTGKLFGIDWAGVTPDIICVGKALSGGMMSFAATITTEKVAGRISQDGNVFMHGPTFMANPLACAVSYASLQLIKTGNWINDIKRIEKGLKQGLGKCKDSPSVANIRVLGGIGVVEMKQAVDTRKLQRFFIEQGVWIRPFGKLIYLMPPYCVTDLQLSQLTAAVAKAVKIV
ncbi:MAG: adenosylmethionine--8-amino-7-oxononanoate transaminase [Thermoguttaceae bacterium]